MDATAAADRPDFKSGLAGVYAFSSIQFSKMSVFSVVYRPPDDAPAGL